MDDPAGRRSNSKLHRKKDDTKLQGYGLKLSTHLLHSKRDIHLDTVLVSALREWVRVLHLRGQYPEANSAARRLAKARKVRIKQVVTSGDEGSLITEKTLEVEDLILHGRIECRRSRLRSSIESIQSSNSY